MKTPLKFVPVTKQIIWGGTRLAREYGKGVPGEKIAESWELTSREDGDNIISGGEYDGKLFSEYLGKNPDAVGTKYKGDRFPLLIKLIDAEADLSIQVHPDDKYAREHTTDLGKTEMWYIVDAAKGAHIIYGMKEKYPRAVIEKAIRDGTLETLMNYVPVKKGETYFIPSGTVHAICRGILIAEIQQNSNITYRVYDYNRRQPDGTLRKLHVEDALNVIETVDPAAVPYEKGGDVIAKCRYFTVHKYENETRGLVAGDESFIHLLAVDGSAKITCGDAVYPLAKGEGLFIPAGLGAFTLDAVGATVIASEL